MDEQTEEFKPEQETGQEPEPDKERKTKRIIYITIIILFVFLIAWISGIVGKIINL